MEYTLIANTGLQFVTTTMSIKPNSFLSLQGGMPLGYTFKEYKTFVGGSKMVFDLCTLIHDSTTGTDSYVSCSDIRDNNLFKKLPGGNPDLDKLGVLQIDASADISKITRLAANSPQLSFINTFASLYITKTNSDGSIVSQTAFQCLLGKWLPMPMFELGVKGQSNNVPEGWCRVKIEALGEPDGQTGIQNFRLIWAFDTGLASDNENANYRPMFGPKDGESKEYELCNRADILLNRFITVPGESDSPVSRYLEILLGINPSTKPNNKYEYIGYYIYLVNFLRLLDGAAPKVTLYNTASCQIPVDMSIDIGNSRTCAVLVENNDFTKSSMLGLTDMTEPWNIYNNAFDMRVVFRQATFGDSFLSSGDDTLFHYKSLVRVGEEAKRLLYHSCDDHSNEKHFTNYSSPKRFLWDDKKFAPDSKRGWEFIIMPEDTDKDGEHPAYIENLSEYFDDEGHFLQECTPHVFEEGVHYSRSSLMVFVMIEMFQQANAYINSVDYRKRWGQVENRRYLRNIIITCPTAMPLKEQRVLRQAAADAAKYLQKVINGIPNIQIIPSPELCKPIINPIKLAERGWLYDEAFANQLVYLYSELNGKYNCNAATFFDLKGHERTSLPFIGKSLTIGTIDIGAGTTDVMITAYGQNGGGSVTPWPLYYDSFYTAGDDILLNLVQNIILEGTNTSGDINQGSISNSLKLRIAKMPVCDIEKIERVKNSFSGDLFNIKNNDNALLRETLASKLVNAFFGENTAACQQTEFDRRCRLDFNTQVSIPIIQFLLERLKEKRPQSLYSYEEIFKNEQPANYVLKHFKYNFGFDFKELKWNFDPVEINRLVQSVVEDLVKKLSAVVYAHHCDVLVLSGRPTGLKPLTELLYKYLPVEPHRMVLFNNYRPGKWFPFNDIQGFYNENQKSVVAVGAIVGYYASTSGFSGLSLDFSLLGEKMTPTARIIGEYRSVPPSIGNVYFTPTVNNYTLTCSFPHYIGAKLLESSKYPARPLYVIKYKGGSVSSATLVLLRRDTQHNPEEFEIVSAIDSRGMTIQASNIELSLQTLADEGNFWMDNGAFTLHINAAAQTLNS